MLSILHYISAGRRLKEWDKTIHMLGGPNEAGSQMMAQRDMIELERNYYRDEARDLGIKLFILGLLAFLVGANYILYEKWIA